MEKSKGAQPWLYESLERQQFIEELKRMFLLLCSFSLLQARSFNSTQSIYESTFCYYHHELKEKIEDFEGFSIQCVCLPLFSNSFL